MNEFFCVLAAIMIIFGAYAFVYYRVGKLADRLGSKIGLKIDCIIEKIDNMRADLDRAIVDQRKEQAEARRELAEARKEQADARKRSDQLYETLINLVNNNHPRTQP